VTTQTTASSEANPYDTIGGPLDQGDIVLDVPWGLVSAPVAVCRPVQGLNATSGKANFAPCDDVRDAFRKKDPREIVHAIANRGPVLVLWHGCQIDKFAEAGKQDKAFAAIVPILPMTLLNETDWAAVRDGQHMSRFHLPGFSTNEVVMPESYADLRHVWPIRQRALRRRVVTLSKHARADLYGHLFTFLTRLTPAERASCPNCKTLLPSEMFFLPAAE